VNYYFRNLVAADPDGDPFPFKKITPADAELTEMGWEVYSEGIYRLLMKLHRDYAPSKVMITENGAAFADKVDEDGKVHDERRIAFLRGYLSQVHRAIQEGAPVRGYFVWSLLDNFEWSFGFSKRFGIVYVDYTTQERIIKDSGWWYKRVIEENAVPLE